MTNTRADHTAALVDAWQRLSAYENELDASESMRDVYRTMWQVAVDTVRAKDAEIKRLREKNLDLVEELRRTYERAVS